MRFYRLGTPFAEGDSITSLDTTSVDIERGPAGAGRNDFPISWLRDHKGGRVFVTKLGHFADVWTNPAFVQHLLQGMRMTAGRIPADFASQRITRTVAEIVWPDAIAADDEGRGHPAHAFLRLQPAR